jgi:hypothetical protein
LWGARTSEQNGVISSHDGSGADWGEIIDKTDTVVGRWELALPNTEEIRNRFKNELIENIMFAITNSGRTPEWV